MGLLVCFVDFMVGMHAYDGMNMIGNMVGYHIMKRETALEIRTY